MICSSLHDVLVCTNPLGDGAELIILWGGFASQEPKKFMDDIVESYIKSIGSPEYSQFIDEFLDDPWIRVIITNITNLQGWENESDDVWSRHIEINRQAQIKLLYGGFNSANPKSFMDNAVSCEVKHNSYNEFIEDTLDNPWLRIIIYGFNEIEGNWEKYERSNETITTK